MMKKHAAIIIATIGATAVFAQTASAQRGFSSRTSSLVSLSGNEAVQKELGVSGEPAAKLSALSDEYRAALTKEITAARIDYLAILDLPLAERLVELSRAGEKVAELNNRLTDEFMPQLKQFLNDDQLLRLKQIWIQAAGIDAFYDPVVAKELALTEAQKKSLSELRTEYLRKQQQLEGDFQQRFSRIRELNAERDAKALEFLTAQQNSKLAALQGPPFDVSQLGFGRRRSGNNQ